mgnify:CR=1 FL=1
MVQEAYEFSSPLNLDLRFRQWERVCVANDSRGTICESSSCVGLDRKTQCWEAADGLPSGFQLLTERCG